MNYSFPSKKSTEISFGLAIAGTSSAPQSVSVVLEKDDVAVSYAANKHNDQWTAVIDNPGIMFNAGPVKLSIRIVLNGKIFTPWTVAADITEELSQPALPAAVKISAEAEPQPWSNDTQLPKHDNAAFAEAAPLPTAEKEAHPMPVPVAADKKMPRVADIVKSIKADVAAQTAVNRKVSLLKSIEPPAVKKLVGPLVSSEVKESQRQHGQSPFSIKKKGFKYI